MEDDELLIEPEECETCREEFEENGIEYTFDYYVKDGCTYCEHCDAPL